MTLVEALVSVTVLIVMVLMFGTIVAQSQQFISVAQASRRNHALAATIGRILRRDLRRASQNGFLAICSDPVNDERNPHKTKNGRLIFTTAGICHSLTHDATGSGGLICYGLSGNSASGSRGNIVCRAALVLHRFNEAGDPYEHLDDEINMSLSYLQTLPRSDPNQQSAQQPATIPTIQDLALWFANRDPFCFSRQNALCVPPRKISHIHDLWQVLAKDCVELSIMWTDGRVDHRNNLRWYGVDPTKPSYSQFVRSGIYPIELNLGRDAYMALWTHHDQTNWPEAIKVRFRIRDERMPKGFTHHEVICNISGP